MSYLSELLNLGGQINPQNSADLNEREWNLNQGVVQAVSGYVITLENTASAADDFYNGKVIQFTRGKQQGIFNYISDYNGTTKQATLGLTKQEEPDTSTFYVIHTYSGVCDFQTHDQLVKSAKIGSGESSVNNFFNECFVKLVNFNNQSINQVKKILSYDGTNKIVYIDQSLEYYVCADTFYIIFGHSGIASAGGANTITLDANASSEDNFYNNFRIDIYRGSGLGQIKKIAAYNGTTKVCTMESNWATQPDNSSYYNIFSGWGGDLVSQERYSQQTNGLVCQSNESCVIYQQLSLDSVASTIRGKYCENTSIYPSSVHTLVVASAYFRLKLISSGTTLVGKIQTILHSSKNKQLTAFLEEPINDKNDCELVRAILCGKSASNRYNNLLLNDQGVLQTEISGPLDPFGNISVSSEIPVIQEQFNYDLLLRTSENLKYPDVHHFVEAQSSPSVAQVNRIYLIKASLLVKAGEGYYFEFYDSANNRFYAWINVDSANTQPTGQTGTAIQVNVLAADSSSQVAQKTRDQINSQQPAQFTAAIVNANDLRITNNAVGTCNSLAARGMPLVSSSLIEVRDQLLQITPVESVDNAVIYRTKNKIKYKPGQGISTKFTAIFDAPSANNEQLAGIGNIQSGIYFGYDVNQQFGIKHQLNGLQEIQRLTVDAASSNGNLLIKLDGVDFSIPVTIGTAQHVAYTIETFNFSRCRWVALQQDNTVIFVSQFIGPRNTNSYTLTSNGTGITGSFLELQTGLVEQSQWYYQYQWNKNRLQYDTIKSAMYLQPQKGNIYKMQYQYLGFGQLRFFVEDQITGGFILLHTIDYANGNTVPSFNQISMSNQLISKNYTSVSNKKVKSASLSSFHHGILKPDGSIFNYQIEKTLVNTNQTVLGTFQVKIDFQSKVNFAQVFLQEFFVNNNSNRVSYVNIYINPPSFSQTNFQFVNQTNSIMLIDSQNTVFPSDNDTLLFRQFIGATESKTFDLRNLNQILTQGDKIVVTGQRTATQETIITINLQWREEL